MEGGPFRRVKACCTLMEEGCIMGRSNESVGQPGASEDLNEASVVDEQVEAVRSSDAKLACYNDEVGWRWTKSCFAPRAEEGELDEPG